MKYVSTRNKAYAVDFGKALHLGLAKDGGLFVPDQFPVLKMDEFDSADDLQTIGRILLKYFIDQASPIGKNLEGICREAFNFEAPLKRLNETTGLLELFHGPTAAFKDFGARFLSECLAVEPKTLNEGRSTVLVATSGDTGGAVASAFYKKPGIDVVILFPKDRISHRQMKQLTSWGENIFAFAIQGDFDDCQRMVKEALVSDWWKQNRPLISANSINLGRLLPQMVYYAKSSLEYLKATGRPTGYIIPSGNLGNAVAALWAKKIGFPIQKVVLATNNNRSISNYFLTQKWDPQPTVSTLANAMDVGQPSNVERLFSLYPNFADLKRDVLTETVSDREISATIGEGEKKWGEVWCPHTATAVWALDRIPQGDWTIVATAHPAKFEAVVEPLIGHTLPIPESLVPLLEKPSRYSELDPSLVHLQEVLSIN